MAKNEAGHVKPLAALTLCSALFGFVLAPTVKAQQAPTPSAHEPSASESPESIDVAGVTLRLGMAQDDVNPRLGIGTSTAVDSSWLVVTKNGAQPNKTVAEVIFTRGRLASVRKFWTGSREPNTAAGFASALYGAFTSIEQEGKTPCKIMTNSHQQSAGEMRTVSITCGGQKHLDIDVFHSAGGQESAGVTEVLGDYAGSQPTVSAFAQETAGSQPAKPMTDAAEEGRREAAELANLSALVTVRAGERFPDEGLSRIVMHNRALCDQIITVAGLTPRGLALYVPPEGQKFMAKNSQNYPRMCLLEDATNFVPGVPRYLLVYAYSENAFAGFQPVTLVNTTTTPVSGSGTVRNAYGDAWNFNYYGTVETTEIDTMEAPYVIQSHSLYLNAYDENGNVVSRHSFNVSSQIGGNGASAIGYNGAQLISLLWNNPSHLIQSVLKDVQKDSQKYGKK